MKHDVYVVVEKGEPFPEGSIIAITDQVYAIGRSTHNHIPDIAFSSLYISRAHAVIRRQQQECYLEDLDSKHGTEVNGLAVKGKPVLLRDGDQIRLAKGEAILHFHNEYEKEWEQTKEFVFPPGWKEGKTDGLIIQPERREVYVDGTAIPLAGKDMELLLYLYQKANQAVSFDEIKMHIWPERQDESINGVPDVGLNEITVLVYRVRKKLGKYGDQIVTIPRFGYMLDL
ncbi:MAG TPA: FHA domain-containing protein [Candidatus Bathyarchaeia archaeon]|nr:FHA domain-containing protein [Candidatus Bathyarchaeia archaeon]